MLIPSIVRPHSIVGGGVWDITKYSADSSIRLASYIGTTVSMAISSDGTKFLFADNTNVELRIWNATTPWDLSTMTSQYSQSKAHYEGNNIKCIDWNSDGTKILFTAGDNVGYWDLGSAYDITFATSYYSNVDGLNSFRGGKDLFSPRHYFMVDNDKLYELYYSSAEDLTSWYDLFSLDISAYLSDPQDLDWSADKKTLYILEGTTNEIHQFVATNGNPYGWRYGITYVGKLNIDATVNDPTSIVFNPDGTAFFVWDSATEYIHKFTL